MKLELWNHLDLGVNQSKLVTKNKCIEDIYVDIQEREYDENEIENVYGFKV